MVDTERRKFLKMGLKLITASSVYAATYPMQKLYSNDVKPTFTETSQNINIPQQTDFSLMNSVVPQIIASSTIMTFIMMYADTLQSVLILLIGVLSFIFFGLPITEYTLSLFR
tara:strand:- start:4797 stop:5135 length:339 start_codon:yes stop_codon:yes gene_type:complete